MINWEKFNDNFQYYEKDIVNTAIDMLLDSYQVYFDGIRESIANRDFDKLYFNAHKFKGGVSNFMDPLVVELAAQLELMGTNKTLDGIDEYFAAFQKSVTQLIQVLEEYKNK